MPDGEQLFTTVLSSLSEPGHLLAEQQVRVVLIEQHPVPDANFPLQVLVQTIERVALLAQRVIPHPHLVLKVIMQAL